MGSGWDVRPHQLTSPFPPDPVGSCTTPHSPPHFPALAISPPLHGGHPGRDGGEGRWRKLPAKRSLIVETREILLQFSRPPPLRSPPGSRSTQN